MGNRAARRLVWTGFVAAAAIAALAGCSGISTSGSASISDPEVVALGAEAAGVTSTPSSGSSSSPTAGWSSTLGCPDTFREGLLSSTPAGTTATQLDASTTTGVPSSPGLFTGDVPNCAYALTISGRVIDSVAFVGMPASYQDAITTKLTERGFVAGAATPDGGGTLQLYSNGVSRIAIEKLTLDGVSFLGITG